MPTRAPDPSARRASLGTLLHYAWAAGEFTATDAMAATGVTRSTAIEAAESLLDLALLRELPNARDAGEYRKGRPARRFSVRADAGHVVGVDAGQAHVTVAVADFAGTIRRLSRLSLSAHGSALVRRAEIETAVRATIAEAELGPEDVTALCAGVAAPVDRAGLSPTHPDRFWQRMNPDLRESFGAWVPLVRIENDASLAAVAEGAHGAASGCANYVTLLTGERFGAGVVVDGHLLRGARGGVGEMVAFDHVNGVGSSEGLAPRARRWAVEAVRAGAADPAGPLARTPVERIDSKLVLELAQSGDAAAVHIAERLGALLARVIAVLGSMFDPERVILSGAPSQGIGIVAEAARRALPTDLDLPAPDVVVSDLGGDVVVLGAVAAAVDLVRTHVLDLRLSAASAAAPEVTAAHP